MLNKLFLEGKLNLPSLTFYTWEIKKQGKQVDVSQLRSQLDMLGLRIIEVTADGNCFFRALADQLEGNEEEHQKYRSMVVKHIMDNRDIFEPFIEDEVPFEEYCQSMQNDGTWAGHMELQAASLVTHSNICIHRNMSPRWYIRNFNGCGARMIHLSYHDGEHYNSVRLKNDPGDGPARPIVIKADADLSATSHQAKVTANKSHRQGGGETFQSGSIKLVMVGSGCESAAKVEQILKQVNGDVDAAIEFLIAERGTEESSTKSDSPPSLTDASGCPVSDENKKKEETIGATPTNDESKNNSTKINGDNRLQRNDKIPRNKVCPCGSKKKYKACCGTALGRQSAKLVVNQAADTRKGRKEKKQGKKGVPARDDVIHEYDDGGTLDMGALCI
ncbi:OTU domain-containing protein 3 isoform X2 [Neltuma alba]|uniref:OTU domain-containing protein 3 isoform X2 n=1 Tax=Neltuma alba TaxID=207710 RepID=UPI0010A4DF8A|nr:OTU domain-containing protein 3 isoform X2 [Prosopis alba]